MKTFSPKPAEVTRRWYVVDAKDQVLGRMASRIAHILRGKHKPIFSPHVDTGDYIVVINAESVIVTGKKLAQKQYHSHSGYPGGLKSESLGSLQARCPERVIEKAVRGMLPKNPLGRAMLRKLKVYRGLRTCIRQASRPK